MDLYKIASRIAKFEEIFVNPGPGDTISITPLGNGAFRITGKLSGKPVIGIAKVHPGGGLEFTPDSNTQDLDEDQYDTLTNTIGELDHPDTTKWRATLGDTDPWWKG